MSVRPIIHLNIPVGEHEEMESRWHYDRDKVVKVIFPESDHIYHVVRSACMICGREITLAEMQSGDVYPTRIDGDSKYGYELYHLHCD